MRCVMDGKGSFFIWEKRVEFSEEEEGRSRRGGVLLCLRREKGEKGGKSRVSEVWVMLF